MGHGGGKYKITKKTSGSSIIEIYIGKVHFEKPSETPVTKGDSNNDLSKKGYAEGLVASVPGIIKAWWSSEVSLWVQIDAVYLSNTNPRVFAQQIADMISGSISNKFGFTCVHVYYGNLRELAKSCH